MTKFFRIKLAMQEKVLYNRLMRIALFGGSFDPVHKEHVNLIASAIRALRLDRVLIMPSRVAPHKREGAHASGEERLAMCRIAFRNLPEAEVSDFELRQENTSYSYLTCRWFAERHPDAERFFLVGADMLENFFFWRNPDEILKNVTLAACGRGDLLPQEFHRRFIGRFGCDFQEVPYIGRAISSTNLRVSIGFGKNDLPDLDEEVFRYLCKRKLYQYPVQLRALDLEKPERREHSFRVACMACERARGLQIQEEKALLASMLHDCGKNVSLSDLMAKGFVPPEKVPGPVMHQYSGAYLAEHVFAVKDEDVLNAIRYHTSGRAEMSELEKLIYLSDLLEEGRRFPGVEMLRDLFWKDLDQCLFVSLKEQIKYLEKEKKSIYFLTKEAFHWISGLQNEKN